MLKIFKISIFIAISTSAFGSLIYTKNSNQLINQYFKYHKKYFKTMCSGRTDEYAAKLYKRYLGHGQYVPFYKDGTLDEVTIKEHLPILKQKQAWISKNIKRLKKYKSFRWKLSEVRSLKKSYNDLLRIKYFYYIEKNFEKKKKLAKESKIKTQKFVNRFEKYLNSLFFLHSFRFPVDHLYLRSEYDKYKVGKTKEEKHKANSIYFLRKIVEEGAIGKKKGRSDIYLRSLIDSVYLRLVSFKGSFLTEDLRYDSEKLLDDLTTVLRRGQREYRYRLNNWYKKTTSAIDFYSEIIRDGKDKRDLLEKMFKSKEKARYALKDYILRKEAKSYNFWSKKDEAYQQLFALETILIHEVGRLDDNYGSERRDVINVVRNRFANDSYNQIDKKESIYKYLKNYRKLNIRKHKWLNVLFKEGEFSFTYFFIPASRGIFCPDQSRSAKKLMKKNLRIIISELRESDVNFKATRYFSRASMLGRINMASLWKGYDPVSERPGPIIRKDKFWKKIYRAKKFIFLYAFTSPDGRRFEVLRYKNKHIVYSPKRKKFYGYRNPHFFTYFIKSSAY